MMVMRAALAAGVLAVLTVPAAADFIYTSANQAELHPIVAPTAYPKVTNTDPWTCVTEGVMDLVLSPPKPSGSLSDAILSFGSSLIETCRTSGTLQRPCDYPDKTRWCGITTALPQSLRPAYSVYASNASSWWSAHSSRVVRVAQECPLMWYGASNAAYGGYQMNQTLINAECYAEANPSNTITTRTTATPGVTSSLATSTTTRLPTSTTTPVPTSTSSTKTLSSTTTSSSSVTVGSNGVATPLPMQPGMVSNCNKFTTVNAGDTCNIIAFFNGPISTENFVLWNPGVGGMACGNLRVGSIVCIGVAATPTSTVSGELPLLTPKPIHPGIVSNCNKFTLVNPGDTCNIISFFNGPISTENFALWNPGVGGPACGNLRVGTYVCIGVIGTPTQTSTTSTTPGNGIATPTPTHPGMVSNCNKFTLVNPGDTCNIVAFYNGPIPTEYFVLWNRGVGGTQCGTLQVGTYACIGLIQPQGGNGIPTPAPAHPGMVGNCDKFAYVVPGDSCDSIAFYNGVAGTQFVKQWNTGVGANCQSLQVGTYVCIGVRA
ncbi:hypothetical protein NEMBOFW57_009553 [Staphylotrichum longicolle]|uniref:LysM domain-containing protein n=1 Tax=Staphylotrichum longicolle TaxID=669026 RepID=A0AAD4EP85_9PEZI|nr:hypothetical protein NEMBOFW57_009553 [Staphylotrichum longicolle]